MIRIDEIGGKDHRYYFPTIDFKFQNTGNATAFLWQFGISVLQAEIDPTPVLEFTSTVVNGALEIRAINNGWGAARQCEILLREPVLDRIFADSTRHYRGTIESGQEEVVFRLAGNLDSPEECEALRKEFAQIDDGDYGHYWERDFQEALTYEGATYGIRLGTRYTQWRCKDEQNKTKKGSESVRKPSDDGLLLFTDIGFVWHEYLVHYCRLRSYVTYCSIIDPSKGSHEQTYPTSRKIPPADVERFHIMVGSRKSCHLRLRFKFYVDKREIIESEEFDIEIWNPRNSRWNPRYEDGTELSRRIDDLQRQLKAGLLRSWEQEYIKEEFERLLPKASNYPFIDAAVLK